MPVRGRPCWRLGELLRRPCKRPPRGPGADTLTDRSRGVYARRVIDLHCHLLPAIDDGPATVEGSLALAEAAEAAGMTTLVATPHVSWRYLNDAASVVAGVELVRTALRDRGIGVDVRAGAEIAMTRVSDLSDDELHGLRLGDGEWLLIECPLGQNAGDFELLLRALQRRGHRIVLAHPERSPLLRRDPSRLLALVSEGMLSSITAGSLVGVFGRDVRRFAIALAQAGLVHNVASDAHDAIHRPPSVREAIMAASGDAPELRLRLGWLTQDIPRAILQGAPLPAPPPVSDARLPRQGRGRGWKRVDLA
jgi:protein-tyrosine phosphatase